MPDDKKAKDKQPKDEAATEETSTEEAPSETGEETGPTAEAAPGPTERAPLSREQAERLRRKLKTKYH